MFVYLLLLLIMLKLNIFNGWFLVLWIVGIVIREISIIIDIIKYIDENY